MFSYFLLETRIPEKHPLWKIRENVGNVLAEMDKEFDAPYSQTGRPNVPSEMLLKVLFLQILYGIRSDRHCWKKLISTYSNDGLLV